MSRLTDLIGRVRDSDPALAADLAREVEILGQRRAFGLNFERHVPETVQLPQRRIRRGDKVVFLPERGADKSSVDDRVWLVTGFSGKGAKRKANLVRRRGTDEPEETSRLVEDLVVVAEFRDPIYPGLVSTGKVEEGGDKPFHSVINGENYHALEALRFAYEGKVDCIYIDPPYNTRDKDWKYNNDYVDSDDRYRHSKWLAMLERRLRVAKDLLNPTDSVLVVTIDEKEYLRLGLLLEQIFPEAAIQMISSVISPGGVPREKEFTRVNEFIFFVMLGSAGPVKTASDMLFTAHRSAEENRSPIWRGLLRGGSGPLRTDNPDKFFPVLVDPESERVVGAGAALPKDEPRTAYEAPEGLIPCWPLKKGGVEGRWELSRPTFDDRLAAGYVRAGSFNKTTKQWSISYLRQAEIDRLSSGELVSSGMNEKGHLEIDYAANRTRNLYAKTVWNEPSHDAGTHGVAVNKALIPGRKFDYPKSLYAVEDALRFFVKHKPNALVLDFFAGSGTTSHAVMRLNKQDGGERRSVCVTNNEVSAKEEAELRSQSLRPGDAKWEELGIAEHITNPRLRAAISGETPEGEEIKGDYKFNSEFPMADGLPENVEFFKLTYEDPARVKHGLGFSEIAPLLWLRAGSQGRLIVKTNDSFDVAERYGVLFSIDAAAGFVEAVKDAEGVRIAYVVTDDEGQYQAIASQLPSRVEAVRLYEAYLENARIGPRSTP